ncbi:MAG: SH3 domain-containing protein [Bacteroidota bacterium]
MKTSIQTLLIILFISITQLNAQQSNKISLYDDLKINETYSLVGDNVNLRAKPYTTSKELTRLRIGFEVTIISKTDVVFKSGDDVTCWYEVSYKGQKGYISGKFIAHKAIKTDTHSFLFGRKMSKEFGDELIIRTLVGTDYSNYKENFLRLRGSVISVALIGNSELKNVQHILFINYHGESCGAENGRTYFFLKDTDELVHIADLASSGDPNYFEEETFTFMKYDQNTQPSIVFKREESEIIDNENFWRETKSLTRSFEWDGTKLVPEFSKRYERPEKSNE